MLHAFALLLAAARDVPRAPLSIGIVGLDTSHVVAFTRLFNDPAAEGPLARMRVVAGWPGGTDLPASADRIAGFTETLREEGVAIVDSLDELLARVDVVLLESVDGRAHLEQARAVFASGKRVFVDKPLAGTLTEVVQLAELARERDVAWFSSSSLRFGAPVPEGVGDVVGCVAWSPCTLEPTHPDLFWYGIHGVEALYTVMGPGCEQVTRTSTAGTDVVTGVWADGRVGTFRGLRDGKAGYGAVVFGTAGIAPRPDYPGYAPLVLEIARFFEGGPPPVDPAVTVELYAFLEAAHESGRRGGQSVALAEVLERARQAAGYGSR